MGALLFYDTETTGLPLWGKPSEDPKQPYVCQLTALLTDLEGKKLASMDALIALPPGVTIEPEAAKAHGITPDLLARAGIPMKVALPTFLALWERAQMRIGHSEEFDARMLRIELIRHKGRGDADIWKKGQAFCTMHSGRDICKIAPTDKMAAANRRHFKNPTLAEAYRHFTGQDLGGKAHNAMFDVMACKAVFFGIQKAMGGKVEPKPAPAAKPQPQPIVDGADNIFGDG